MTSLILVGCGKMGGAMLAGWLETGFVDEAIYVVEPNATVIEQFASAHGIIIVAVTRHRIHVTVRPTRSQSRRVDAHGRGLAVISPPLKPHPPKLLIIRNQMATPASQPTHMGKPAGCARSAACEKRPPPPLLVALVPQKSLKSHISRPS